MQKIVNMHIGDTGHKKEIKLQQAVKVYRTDENLLFSRKTVSGKVIQDMIMEKHYIAGTNT